MSSFTELPLFAKLESALQDLFSKVDDTIAVKQKKLEACKKRSELELRVAEELKLNRELTDQLHEVSGRGGEVARLCGALQAGLAIADSDQARLDNAREMYQVAKELTGIRWDFSAPPNVAKGYIRSEARKLLDAFELSAEEAAQPAGSGALWARVLAAADAENLPPRNH